MSDSDTAYIWVIGSILFYFLPFIIALLRGHRNTLAIFALDLLLGWTLIGWVIALVWSLTRSPEVKVVTDKDSNIHTR